MPGSIASDALVAVAPKSMSMPRLGKLTRAQMEKLLSDCFKEQRAPTIHELCTPTPKKCRISYKTGGKSGTPEGGIYKGEVADLDESEIKCREDRENRTVFCAALHLQKPGVKKTSLSCAVAKRRP